MRKKALWLSVFLLLVLTVILAAGRRQALRSRDTQVQKQTAEEKERVVVVFSGGYADTPDMELVQEAVNRIVQDELGISVELRVISGQYNNKVEKMLAGREQVDIVNMGNQLYMESYINGHLCDIEQVLQQYGQGIIQEVGMENIDACRINDTLYGLTNNRDYAAGWDAYALRKDILDKYGINKEDIRSIEDLEAIYDLLLKEEPDLIPIASGGNLFGNFMLSDGMNGFPAGGHLNYGQDEEVVNIFESREYRENLYKVRRWYLKGYLGDYSPIGTNKGREMIRQGKAFSITSKGKPGIEQQESMSTGRKMVVVQFGETAISYNSLSVAPWVITKNTACKESAMKVLNLFYTSADIMNLLSYGVEGIHYVKTEDGHITLPEGKSENIFISNSWRMPNQFITYVWEGNPLNLWERMKEHNKNALQSCEIGFNFDISNVTSQYVAVNHIYSKYKRVLENGLVDPDEGLEAMLSELRENGLDEVIEEKRRQFQEWKNK